MTHVCSPEPNAVVSPEYRPMPPTNPDPSEIGPESWAGAERATRDILSKIQPTVATHRRRKDVILYVQSLISSNVGCQVFPYGSVPLKTYLPDGDIDLTIFSGSPQLEDVFVAHVHAVLKGEENNEAARYHVKDVHRIDAEVKLVKCIVQDMIVDISFNQLGGLNTLRFLEQVDHYIGKYHIFKRSIILIKAWCYYESRILGAHHGLISTYALETLVLYVFHLFHSSLDGPLTVLHKFLDYFSKFDWENYCVSLNGPVCKSSLPNIVAEVPDNGGDDVLLSEEFIKNCVDMFSVPSKKCEAHLRFFSLKNLNIIDTLKENNNLGRSVNRGSFYRICSAFKFGARKLGWILLLPPERVSDELNKFFANTLDRHESKCQTTVQNDALLDLGEDLDSHCQNMQFSPIGNGCATSPPLLPSPPLSPQQWKENPWEVTSETLQSQHNIGSQINGIAWGTHAYHTNGSNFYVPPFREEKNKPRGTGTYIPNTNYRPYKDRHWFGRGRKESAGTYPPLQRHTFSYGFPVAPQESISPGECNHQLSEAEFPVLINPNSATSDYHQPQLSVWEPFHENGFSNIPDKPESRSSSPQSWEEVPMPELDSSQLSGIDEVRIEEHVFHLKNEDDFPPLTPRLPLEEGICTQ
ncbi:uncharacterized protein LOC126789262 isoform X2 [Argentina anserina]|uniref:uncharacterized protein LOC126789262 isoform X2 n=1 Tax=Argentina anserina TaxID=57926 RepID=UPI00217633B0|nr:uncharacterized protein LOC126789262 isoform X2 [Potentilla anserina]